MNDEAHFDKALTELLRRLVNEFIFHPADLEISSKRFQRIINLSWRGNRGDTSRMIGKGGGTHKHLARLLALIGAAHGYDVELERVGEPVRGKAERYDPFKARADWPKARILTLLQETARLGTKHGLVELGCGDLTDSKTAVQVDICRTETLHTETMLEQCLRHVFNVIGNANGRVITVKVVRSLEPDVQPERSDGRYARQK